MAKEINQRNLWEEERFLNIRRTTKDISKVSCKGRMVSGVFYQLTINKVGIDQRTANFTLNIDGLGN